MYFASPAACLPTYLPARRLPALPPARPPAQRSGLHPGPQVLLRPSMAHYPAAPGESQMAINTLRAAELLSDDSNFRAGLIPLLAPTSAHLLASGALHVLLGRGRRHGRRRVKRAPWHGAGAGNSRRMAACLALMHLSCVRLGLSRVCNPWPHRPHP